MLKHVRLFVNTIRTILPLFLLLTVLNAQTLDVLQLSHDAVTAGSSLLADPVLDPARLNQPIASKLHIGGWNWIAGINGVNLNWEQDHWAMGLRTVLVDDIEVRGDTPTSEPLSTSQYSLVMSSLARGFDLRGFQVGIGASVLRERGLQSKAWGAGLHASVASRLGDNIEIGAGIRHLGAMQALESEAADLPTDFWGRIDYHRKALTAGTEISLSERPLRAGISYSLIHGVTVSTGFVLDAGESKTTFLPSAGLAIDREPFTIALAFTDLTHTLGSRQFFSLIWHY